MSSSRPIAVAGATGYIGGLLTERLLERGESVCALARSPDKAADLQLHGAEVREADALEPASLAPALEGTGVAYYLVHSMGRGSGAGYAERDRRAATNFRAAAEAAGVERIVYLGGLGDGSEHLRSRNETAEVLSSGNVPVTYFRAAAVIGEGSESFRTMFYLVRRLPVMVTPRWTSTRTQPIAVDDVVGYLAEASLVSESAGRELQIGGPEVTTYGGMMDMLARVMGRRPPLRVTVPVLTPHLSSLWVGLVTPVDSGVARPLIEGLATETVVRDESARELFDVPLTPLPDAMRSALAEPQP
jgi:uncharacterized protein YbjT (DUF2867 family)